ncbi:hypothetical protein NDU88_001119 [Pleurodeles waltl]|uniref:Uncharacterized protein n=1 Tax=Pleurodeles waltl TaxID=8319 RepID=A0AAV7V7A6_PLEWA|nr:hypothetical protein NDU88_001119 [Pleurodeles waltl]
MITQLLQEPSGKWRKYAAKGSTAKQKQNSQLLPWIQPQTHPVKAGDQSNLSMPCSQEQCEKCFAMLQDQLHPIEDHLECPGNYVTPETPVQNADAPASSHVHLSAEPVAGTFSATIKDVKNHFPPGCKELGIVSISLTPEELSIT